MNRKILKCISTIDELDIAEYNKLKIGVEIQDFTEPNLTEEDINNLVFEYKKAFKGFTNIKSLHGPFLDLKPSSPDLEIRHVSQKRYIKALNIANELKIDYITFHSQINPYLKEPSLNKLNNSQSKEFWDDIIELVDYKGIILIENIFEETPEMLKELIETINLPNIKVNLDIGHAKLGKSSLEEWVRQLKDHIVYIHCHSNDGILDQHRAPSQAEVKELLDILDKYNMDPYISLEYKVKDILEELCKFSL